MTGPDWVLLLDDDPWALEITSEMLTRHGITVHATRTEAAALAAIERDGAPSVLLLDVMMPGADGYSVCRRLRANEVLRHTRVVFVTSLHDEPSRLAALGAGADDLIAKPISEAILIARIRSLIELARLRDRSHARMEYEVVLDSIGEGVLTMDAADRILKANGPARRLLGLPAGPLAGSSLTERLSEGWKVERGQLGSSTTARLVASEPRSVAAIDWTSHELPPGEATEAAWTVIIRDATDAWEQDRALGRLIRTLSHKVRTPLTGLGTSLELVAESGELDAECQELIDVARSSATRLNDTLLRILDFVAAHTSQQRGTPETVQAGSMRSQLGLSDDVELGAVPARPITIELALARGCVAELTANAFNAGATRVTLDVGVASDDAVTFAVTDDGPGLPLGSAERIFEPFYQLDRSGEAEGTGLGLAMVAAEVKSRGGAIGATTPAGGPTTVWFRIPCLAPRGSGGGAPVELPATRGGGERSGWSVGISVLSSPPAALGKRQSQTST